MRFAPSPTGPLHIGGIRTALFNFLFARNRGGEFILRIEDTDQARFVPGAEQYIIESLKWCGIQYDEGPDIGGPYGPYRQSDRKAIYREFAERLIAGGHAYYAFDTPEEINAKRKAAEASGNTFQYDWSTRRQLNNSLSLSSGESKKRVESGMPYVVRFRMPENDEVSITDLIRGEVVFRTGLLDDKVLFKADGLPTYHLANVVDDYLMKITHVIRGEEWLPSLPLHILLYKAFGWEDVMPSFAHLPLILKPGGQGKLSKRDGDKLGFPVFPLQWVDPVSGEVSSGYRETGYLPEAVANMLAMLGWNPGTEQELFTMEELIRTFSLERVGRSGSRFDPEKAKWYNQQYLKRKTDEELAAMFMPVLASRGIERDPGWIAKLVRLIRERIVFPQDMWEKSFFFFQAPLQYDQQMVKKVWKNHTAEIIGALSVQLLEVTDFSSTVLEEKIKSFAERQHMGTGQIMAPLRLLLVGSGTGPHLFDLMELLGKDETVRRIQKGLHEIH